LYILNMRFDWDPHKEEVNVRKHGISFREALTVWADEDAFIMPDPEHSVGELREWILGASNQEKLMVVVFIYRDDRVRIISARPVTKREREGYVGQF
jgi:uncharacterized protein